MTQVLDQSPGPTERKEKIYFQRLSSDLHKTKHTWALTYTLTLSNIHPFTEYLNDLYYILSKIFNLKTIKIENSPNYKFSEKQSKRSIK